MFMLPLKQGLFALHAPFVAAERPILPDNAVTGDNHCNVVVGDSVGNGPCGCGLSHRFSDFAVGASFTDGNLLQRLPNTLLEGRTANIQWKFDVRLLSLDVT